MIDSITAYLQKWNSTKNDRQKLQGVYLTLGCTIIILAGLMTLLNANVGYAMVMIGFMLIGAFLLNAISWHLLSSIFLSQLKAKRLSSKSAPKAKR